MRTFETILIANRGEIALRILRTCRDMGIAAVGVYTEADRDAAHARNFGALAPIPSYLDVNAVVAAARRTGAQAIHPGYGFLSENADFAEACERAGIVFIGPPVAAIRAMGSKRAARELALAAGVPVVPGSVDATVEAARAIGFPVLIKASAGGGGRGMRIVRADEEFAEAVVTARSEAQRAFGDGTLLLEKFIEGARHVEFQIFGDVHGTLIHLYERDCTTQRRYQKVLEESPSPALDVRTRKRMAAAALTIGRAMQYTNAGTVEFLLAPNGEFYFLEVNTRIQVEHPVTEMVTGLDLVRLQIEIAEGKPLPSSVSTRGHAIEARLYAEDPTNDFLPSSGTLHVWRPPTGVRVDSGVTQGQQVGIEYDPLLAKLIAHAGDREGAVRKLTLALRELFVAGVATNRDYLLQKLGAQTDAPLLPFLAGAVMHWIATPRAVLPEIPASFRNNPYRDPSIAVSVEGEEVKVSWRCLGHNRYIVNGEEMEFLSGGDVVASGVRRHFEIVEAGDKLFVHCATLGTRTMRKLSRLPRSAGAADRETANSPMPGSVLRILVRVGQDVRVGDALVVLEAMKMEQTIRAKVHGVVRSVLVETGQVVGPGQMLVEIGAKL